jgi:hypothetical protein
MKVRFGSSACEQDWRYKAPDSGLKETFIKRLSGALFCYTLIHDKIVVSVIYPLNVALLRS